MLPNSSIITAANSIRISKEECEGIQSLLSRQAPQHKELEMKVEYQQFCGRSGRQLHMGQKCLHAYYFPSSNLLF